MLSGKIVGFFETFVVDGLDADLVPDLQRLSGTIVFTPSVSRIIDNAPAIPGEPQVSSAVLGALPYRASVINGFLSTPLSGAKWLYVPSTDDPNVNPQFTNYSVSYDLSDSEGRKVELPTHLISVPPYTVDGDEVDLAQLIPPANGPAYGVPQAEAAANRAAAALALSVRTINGEGPDENGNIDVAAGGQANDGITPNVQAGDTATGNPGTLAQVVRRSGSTDANPIFDFLIPQGLRGIPGNDSTVAGPPGTTPAITLTVKGLSAGSNPTVVKSGTTAAPSFELGIPAGAKGTDGTSATTPTITITVKPLAAGANPTVTKTGTDVAPSYELGIPAGAKGDTGTTPAISVAVNALSAGASPTVARTGTDAAPTITFGIPAGAKGDPGTTPAISATVTGLATGASPTVTKTGTDAAPSFAFGIPAGPKGADGTNGTNGSSGAPASILVLPAGTTTVPAGTAANTIVFTKSA